MLWFQEEIKEKQAILLLKRVGVKQKSTKFAQNYTKNEKNIYSLISGFDHFFWF
jgi:CRISPR/Cas system-associated endonuclease Cas3-HD